MPKETGNQIGDMLREAQNA